MPIRVPHAHPALPELDVQAVHRLISGRVWFFIMDEPAFANDQEALACYRQIRHMLLPWCQHHFNAMPWAEGLHTGRPCPSGAPPGFYAAIVSGFFDRAVWDGPCLDTRQW